MDHIVLIGNGVAGITAARHIRKNSDHRITVISSESPFFFSRTALMYVYMGHMKFEHIQPYENDFWAKNRIDLLSGHVEKVNPEQKTLELSDGKIISFDKLVIASGSKPNYFGWPGQDLKGVQGLYSRQDLELLEENSKGLQKAVIVGGGLIGIELAEMLSTRNISVTFLVREPNFWSNVLPEGEAKLINRHIKEHHIDLRLGTNLKAILPDENGRVKAVITDTGETIPCQLVGLTAGVSPNIDFLKDSGIHIQRGVLVNQYLETNYPDIYAIGDCAEQQQPTGLRRPIEAVWYTARMMGETLAQTLCGNKMPYKPGNWFNSAKFFDIEYQTYGWVFANPLENEAQFYWEHPDGKKAIRLSYDRGTDVFLGVNVFGIRLRHEVLDRWLNEQRSVDYVMAHLEEANFDPEFFAKNEAAIRMAYRKIKPSLQTL